MEFDRQMLPRQLAECVLKIRWRSLSERESHHRSDAEHHRPIRHQIARTHLVSVMQFLILLRQIDIFQPGAWFE